MQSAMERRMAIYNLLLLNGKMSQRQIIAELQPEFTPSMTTIRRDINYLTVKNFVTTARGRNGGIILKDMTDYNWKSDFRSVLENIQSKLTEEEEIAAMDEIIQLKLKDHLTVRKRRPMTPE